jgi:hypothetical protein
VAESFRAIASAISRIGPDRKKVSSPRPLVFRAKLHFRDRSCGDQDQQGSRREEQRHDTPDRRRRAEEQHTAAASGMHGSTSRRRVTCTELVLLLPAAARPSDEQQQNPQKIEGNEAPEHEPRHGMVTGSQVR